MIVMAGFGSVCPVMAVVRVLAFFGVSWSVSRVLLGPCLWLAVCLWPRLEETCLE